MTVHVLETAVRDGGYEISHQFTEEDVALAVRTLDHAGVSYIEVGYGMGVGARSGRVSSDNGEPQRMIF